jgi:CheY-like chemotaxis protein
MGANIRRILIADDEPYVTTILAAKLLQIGAHVVTCSDGEEALAKAADKRPDLIITDYQMPLMSGFEMSLRLRQDPRTQSIPVVMLTARGHHLTEVQLAKTNIKALFAKPFSAKEVVGKVQELLGPIQDIDPAAGADAA